MKNLNASVDTAEQSVAEIFELLTNNVPLLLRVLSVTLVLNIRVMLIKLSETLDEIDRSPSSKISPSVHCVADVTDQSPDEGGWIPLQTVSVPVVVKL